MCLCGSKKALHLFKHLSRRFDPKTCKTQNFFHHSLIPISLSSLCYVVVFGQRAEDLMQKEFEFIDFHSIPQGAPAEKHT